MFNNTAKPFLLLPLIVVSVTVILFNACTNDKGPQPVDCDLNPVLIEKVFATKATCGVSDGIVTVNVSGGSGMYLYSINGESFQTDNSFENLFAGKYAVFVMDDNNCSVTDSVRVESSSGMTVDAAMTHLAGCGTEDGTVSISANGGVPPYQYKLMGGSYQGNQVITGIPAGKLTFFARDSIGCEVSAQVQVLSGISLDTDISPILETNCALSGCHDGKSGLPDWTDQNMVIEKASLIKKRTQEGSMPPGGRSITNDEKQLIACWVDDGAKDN